MSAAYIYYKKVRLTFINTPTITQGYTIYIYTMYHNTNNFLQNETKTRRMDNLTKPYKKVLTFDKFDICGPLHPYNLH